MFALPVNPLQFQQLLAMLSEADARLADVLKKNFPVWAVSTGKTLYIPNINCWVDELITCVSNLYILKCLMLVRLFCIKITNILLEKMCVLWVFCIIYILASQIVLVTQVTQSVLVPPVSLMHCKVEALKLDCNNSTLINQMCIQASRFLTHVRWSQKEKHQIWLRCAQEDKE